MITAQNIRKSFRGQSGHFWEKEIEILKGVTFEIKENRIVGFLGANGAGKTTFLKILMGFISQTSGEITFSPILGQKPKEIKSQIGYLPERPYFHQNLTGHEFIHYMGELNGLNKRQIREAIEKWADVFKIRFALDREIKKYSKGMLQRLGFLISLIHDPKIVILDEPLSGLDPLGRKELKDVLKELKDLGKTIFFSSHIVSDVEEVCDDVIFLNDGKIEYSGSVEEKLKDSGGKTLEQVFYIESV